MLVILLTANCKFLNSSTCSKEPIKRAGKVCGDFQDLKSSGEVLVEIDGAVSSGSQVCTVLGNRTALYCKNLLIRNSFLKISLFCFLHTRMLFPETALYVS